jgi:phenylpropionate dioxygenase-like ring-hydroxylating dioxygenase large terminal subunit
MLANPESFILGESPLPVPGAMLPQEVKSPPLREVTPEHEKFFLVDPLLYCDARQMEREWQGMWTKTWVCAGRLSDLRQVGDWIKFDFGRESFIIARSAADKVSAFYNVCQHRGARLVREEFGKTSRFVCPYHSWSYDREGRCKSVTDRDLFRSESLCGELNIKQVRCESLAGFVFINMDDNAMSLRECFGPIPELLKDYCIEEMIVRNDVTVDQSCNWKTLLDAFSENYHVHMAHPAASYLVDEREVQMDFYPNGQARRITPIGVHNSRRGPPGPINDAQRFMLSTVGLDPEKYQGDSNSVRRAMQLAKRAMKGRAAEVYGPLSDGQLTDDWAMNLFPNMHWSTHAEGMLMLQYLPHATYPERCQLRIMVLGHRGMPFDSYMPAANDRIELERPPRIHIRHSDPNIESVIGLLLWEDVRLTNEVQKGLRSRGFGAMRLSEHEQVIRHQHAQLKRYLDRLDSAS